MRSSSGVWGWVVSGYFCPWAHKPHVWVRIASVHIPTPCFVFQCSSKRLQPGQGWHVVVNVSVWLPRVTGHRTVGTHWGGRCWSRPLSWPWRSQRSVWGPAGRWGCSPSAAAPGSNSPTPLWRPGREEEGGRVERGHNATQRRHKLSKTRRCLLGFPYMGKTIFPTPKSLLELVISCDF